MDRRWQWLWALAIVWTVASFVSDVERRGWHHTLFSEGVAAAVVAMILVPILVARSRRRRG